MNYTLVGQFNICWLPTTPLNTGHMVSPHKPDAFAYAAESGVD